jgi:hypothetical protein
MFTVQIRRKGDASKVLRAAQRALFGKKKVKAGFPAGKASGGIIMRAVWNEFGTSNGLPERPFMRNAIEDNKGAYRAQMAADARQVVLGKATLETALNRLGLKAQGDIQASIASNTPPPLKPQTIRRKGSSRTLIDTGQMRQSVTFDLE